MRVGIIGAGLQGQRRSQVVKADPTAELAVISSATLTHASGLASVMGCAAAEGWQSVVDSDELDCVLICTPPDSHAQIAIAAMRTGKHVLCEKPLCRSEKEGLLMLRTARETGRILKCGFNHRHHLAVLEAKRLFDAGAIGKPIFARSCYGIGGRPGYENEWRSNPAIAAGGHFMEQGIHAVDLCRWFFGDFEKVSGFVQNGFWSTEPLEDNGFALFQTRRGEVCSIHSSLTQWKNRFSFELFGTEGYLIVEGLGRSYGDQKLIAGRREFGKPFSERVTEFRGQDASWEGEWREFGSAIREAREPLGSGTDGLQAMRLVFALYASARLNASINPQTLLPVAAEDGELNTL
jgi:predicted dehydrogenase